jgi:[acyl-carrier-protein] S-malonyltransferase
MVSATDDFHTALSAADLRNATVPMVFNHAGEVEARAAAVPTLLSNQLREPVRFDAVMATLIQMEIETFVEIGPGRVLRGLVRLNDTRSDIVVHNVSDLRSLERAAAALTG